MGCERNPVYSRVYHQIGIEFIEVLNMSNWSLRLIIFFNTNKQSGNIKPSTFSRVFFSTTATWPVAQLLTCSRLIHLCSIFIFQASSQRFHCHFEHLRTREFIVIFMPNVHLILPLVYQFLK